MIFLIVVSDTAPIIFLFKLEQLTILKDLYSIIYIPDEVWNELIYSVLNKEKELPFDIKFEIEAKEKGWLR